MDDSGKKLTAFVCVGVAAAAAAIAVVAAVYKFKNAECADAQRSDEGDHRHLKQVLSDCYDKISEIEARIPVQD